MELFKNRLKNQILKLRSTGFAHLFGSSVINKVLSFISSIILVRLIPKSDYGVYSNADNILGMFCLLEGFSMTTAMLQFGCTNEGKKKEDIWSFCFYFSVSFQILLSTAIMFTAAFAGFSIPGTGRLLFAMAFLPLPRLIRDLQQVYLRTESKNKLFAYSNTFSTAVTVVLSCLLSVFFLAYGLVIAHYISAVLTIIFLAAKGNVKLPRIRNDLKKSEIAKILKFSGVCVINNSTASVMYLLDTFVLGIVVASSTVTASYKVASKLPTALSFIPTCVMIYIYPYFARNKDNGEWCLKNYKKTLLVFGAFNLFIVLFLILLAPYIIPIIFGKQYLDCLVPFRLLCLNYFIQATFGIVSGQLLVSQEKLGYNTFNGILSSVVNTVLNLVLIPLYSSTGAALATVFVTILSSAISTFYMFRVLNQKLRSN